MNMNAVRSYNNNLTLILLKLPNFVRFCTKRLMRIALFCNFLDSLERIPLVISLIIYKSK